MARCKHYIEAFDCCAETSGWEDGLLHTEDCYYKDDECPNCRYYEEKADVVEVKHGEWVYWQPNGINHLWKCSVCNGAISTPMKFVADHIKYCEHCGAKMDGERKCDE